MTRPKESNERTSGDRAFLCSAPASWGVGFLKGREVGSISRSKPETCSPFDLAMRVQNTARACTIGTSYTRT
jgi:hypothetical protein